MAKTVKMADIAAKLGVSTVTVSKALSGQKGVSEEMREKIKKLAQEMGYKSPTAVKMMKNKRAGECLSYINRLADAGIETDVVSPKLLPDYTRKVNG